MLTGRGDTVGKMIVTGAAGFLGSNLVEQLSQTGHLVYAVVRPNSMHASRLAEIPNVRLVKFDISDNTTKLEDLINEKCDCLFHLAWHGDFFKFDDQIKNIEYSINILNSAKKIGCSKFIGAGSQAEYLVTDSLMSEQTQILPRGPYGAAKVGACFATRELAKELGIAWIWGRIFSVYGKNDLEKHLIPQILNAYRNKTTIQLSSCRQMWDFLAAEDFADAFIALSEKGQAGEIYNVADGRYRSLKEYIEIIKSYIGDETIRYGDDPAPFISMRPDVSKIQRDTGWKPRIDFGDMMELLVNVAKE